jgi:FkbM family methyltransferase
MLATLKARLGDYHRLRNRVTGKSRRMVDQYLSQPKPHDDKLAMLLGKQDSVTIFDVGACECLDSIRYLRMFPQATIHAFEADSRNACRAAEMLERSGATSIQLNNIALSSTIGELDFYSSAGAPSGKSNDRFWDYGNKSGSILEPDMHQIASTWSWLRFQKNQKVACTTLAEYCKQMDVPRIDLLHLDVQGAELLVLQGAGTAIGCISNIWLEVSSKQFHFGQAIADELHAFLTGNGFSCRLRVGAEPQWDELWCHNSMTTS